MPDIPDVLINLTIDIEGEPNFHLYVTPGPDVDQLKLIFVKLKADVSYHTPAAGVFKLNADNTGTPLFRVIALGPFAAFKESRVTLFLNAQTSHCPTSESPTATPSPASILSSCPEENEIAFKVEGIVIFLTLAVGLPNIHL